jgi:two-component system NarL family response regulator
MAEKGKHKVKAKRIKVLIVDDHLMVRKGLALLISEFKDLQLVGEASNAIDAIELFKRERPDVTLMDMVLPDTCGAKIIRSIKKIQKDAAVIALTSFGEEDLITEAIRAGARGFLYKNISVEELAEAIRKVHAGQVVLDPKASDVLLKFFSKAEGISAVEAVPDFSERELTILQLLAQGLTNKQIAARLEIEVPTVKQYLGKIFPKLKAQSRTEAVASAMRQKLIKA